MTQPRKYVETPILMPAPLFDRLIDEDPSNQEEAQPLKTYTIEETLQSIGQELSRLLNTRTSTVPYSIYASREELNTQDLSNQFGLPDFSTYDITNPLSAQRLIRQITRVVAHYESRLTKISVRILGLDVNKKLIVEISGILYALPSLERFTFNVEMENSNK